MQLVKRGTIGWALAMALVACLAPGAQAGSGAGAISVTLPRQVNVERRSEHAPSVHGHVALGLPVGWQRRSGGNHAAHLTVPLSSSCTGEVEVQVNVSLTRLPIAAEVRKYVDFWFDTGVPAPLKVLASRSSAARRFVLAGTSEPLPSPGTSTVKIYSPFFGVVVKRIAPRIWVSIGLGPRIPTTCAITSELEKPLAAGLLAMLRTAHVSARLG